MNLFNSAICLLLISVLFSECFAKDCSNVKKTNSKLICYYSKIKNVDSCYCTHVVVPVNTEVKEIEELKQKSPGVKILLTVNEFNQGLVKTVKQNLIDGLELNLKKLTSKDDVPEFINTIKQKFGNDLFLALSLPPKTELLAKYYDLKALTKSTDLFILQTAFLGASKNVTFHPSRLSGLWDMQNTDSVVDLVTGLGAPLSRLVVTAPVQAFRFTLQDATLTIPGSPALELSIISRKELCEKMNQDEKDVPWTLERDQDQTGLYIFRQKEWIAFEDSTSMDIKAKYARIRGLAGLALKDLTLDNPTNSQTSNCDSLLAAAHAGLSKQGRAPRGAVLRSLEREILDTHVSDQSENRVNVSPFRITRIVDTEGHVHSVRKDTRTEFSCTRQGYFVHPRSCGRFYRCVRFDQQSEDYSVFEFDCPAGLAFDERVEVCVWPGSLSHGTPCQGSSEIAPVPKKRFTCPSEAGYYVDPENCRWFFACLDHGQSGLTAYEFRCPFGLVFDEKNLLCEWPWLVPSCGSTYISGLELDSITYFGGSAKSSLIFNETSSGQLNHLQNGNQLLLTTGAHLIDNYDGLGSLGNVVLGGYTGDINLLKNSLQNEYSLGQELRNTEQNVYSGHLSNIQNENYETGSLLNLDQEGKYLGNSGAILTTSNLGANQNSGFEFNKQHNAESFLTVGNEENSARTLQSSSNLEDNHNIGYEINGQSGFGLHNAASFLSAENGENFGKILQSTSSLEGNRNIGFEANSQIKHGQQNAKSFLSVNNGENSGIIHSTSNLGLNVNFEDSLQNKAKIDLNSFGTGTHAQTGYNRYYGQISSNEGLNVNLAQVSGENLYRGSDGAVLVNNKNYEQVSSNVGLSDNLEQVSGENLYGTSHSSSVYHGSNNYGQINSNLQSHNLEQNLNTADKIGVIHFGTQFNGENLPGKTSQSTYIHHDNSEIVNQGSILNHDGDTKYIGQIGITSDISANQGKLGNIASSSIEFNKFKQNNQENIEKLILNPVSEEKTVLIDSNIRTNNYQQKYVNLDSSKFSNEAKSSSSFVQFHGNDQKSDLLTKYEAPSTISFSPELNSQSRIIHGQDLKVIPVEGNLQLNEKQIQFYEDQLNHEDSKSKYNSAFSSTHHHQTPVIHLEQQPVVAVQQNIELKTPVIHQHEILLQKQNAEKTNLYQTPVVQYQQKLEQPVAVYQQVEIEKPVIQQQEIFLQKQNSEDLKSKSHSSFSSTYHYQTPVVHSQQPVEIRTQPIQQEVLLHKAKSNSAFSSTYHHHTPVVHLEQKQPIEIQTPVVHYEEKLQPVTLQQEIGSSEAKSHSSFSSTYHHQTPAVHLKQPVAVQQYVDLKTPVVNQQEVLLQHKNIDNSKSKSNSAFSSTYHYQNPAVQYEKQPVIQHVELKTPVIQENELILQNQNIEDVESKSNSAFSSTYYQSPIVQQNVELKTPAIPQQQQQIKLQSQSGFSSSYVYQTPVTQFEIQQPVVQQQVEIKTPIIQQQEILIGKQNAADLKSKSQSSFSSTYHYQTPVVQYEQPIVQQHVELKTPVAQQQEVVLQKQNLDDIKSHSAFSSTYHYQTPVAHYEQEAVELKTPVIQEQKILLEKQNVDIVNPKFNSAFSSSYHYQTPVVQYKEQQPVVHQQIELKTPVVQQQQIVLQKQNAEDLESKSYSTFSSSYHYQTPVVQYEQKLEQPVAVHQQIEIKTPVIQQKEILLQNQNSENFKSKSQSAFSSTYQYQTPVTHYEQQPIVQHVELKTPVAQEQKILLQKPNIEDVKTTYHYQTPVVQYEQKLQQPVVQHHTEVQAPIIEQQYLLEKQNTGEIKSKSQSYYSSSSYNYQTPVVHYEQKLEQPVAVHQQIELKGPQIHHQEINFQKIATPKYETQFETVTPTYESGYQEIKIPLVEQPAPFVTKVDIPVTPKYESYSTTKSREYLPPKIVSSTVKPQIYLTSKPQEVFVSTTPKYSVFQEFVQPKQTFEIKKIIQPLKIVTPAPKIVESYEYLPQKPNPAIISEYQYENPDFAHYESQLNFKSAEDLSYQYQPTKVPIKSHQTEFILSSPNPTFSTTIAPILKQTPTIKTKAFAIDKYETFDNKYFVTSPKPIYVSTSTQSESILPEFKYYDSRFNTPVQKVVQVDVTSEKPILRKKIYLTTTEVPQNYDYYDEQLVISTKPAVITTYRPQIRKNYVSTTSTSNYDDNLYVVTTKRPILRKKIVTTTIRPIVKKKKIITSSENYNIDDVEITPRPKSRKIVRVNDFHPFLTTKLGAQCTCVSNTLKLRQPKEKVTDFTEYDIELPENVPVTKFTDSGPASIENYNEPGIYVVGNDYDYESKKLVTVTKSPDVIIQTTTNAIQSAPTPVYTRKKVTTVQPEEREVLLQNQKSKEEKIAEAVNEGLSLVKSAIKGYVKEAVKEETRNLDRYGPGGWRSRDETLQGSADCQRAGLFRHPTQCNKFYACHWDCTKQRYTLHVFNCPVHLTFDTTQGACNWPSKGPSCAENTLLPNV